MLYVFIPAVYAVSTSKLAICIGAGVKTNFSTINFRNN